MIFTFCVGFLTINIKCADHSDRAFYKELVKVIEASDVILEVLDARDPLGTRCIDMEKMVMKAGPDKHLVLLLNKIGKFLPRVPKCCSLMKMNISIENRCHTSWLSLFIIS